MTFEQPTFEEYQSATSWAKFKYKYGIIVLILCWLCLLFIIYYMFTHGEAISRNPLMYGAEKSNVECHCYNFDNPSQRREFYVNATSIWIVKTVSARFMPS